MKRLLLLICTLLCANVLFAQTFWLDSLQYNVTSTNQVEVYDANSSIITANIPTTVTYQGITYSVTSIGNNAFYNCSSLTSVNIPNSVTSIGEYAFVNCSSLTSITIPNSVTSIGEYAFVNCSSLTSITIPNSVTSIGSGAFRLCSSLTSITIPNSVTSIGSGAFRFCSSLTSVILPNNANISSFAFESTGGINVDGIYYGGAETVNIGNYTFNNVGFIKFYLNGNETTITPSEVSVIDCDESLSGDIVISSTLSYQGTNYNVTSIGEYAFGGCSSLTSVTIPNSVTSIGVAAFHECSSLTSITIPNSVTSIGGYAFQYCSSLTSITIPNSVTSIGTSAFYDCSSLTSVNIPNSVTSIGEYAFVNCSSLTSITIPNSVTSIRAETFYNCSSLTSVNIPNSVTSIGEYAFKNCSSLTSITIPNSVTSIGGAAFYGCSSLTSVSLNMSSIPANLFPQSTALQNLTFGENVTSIASGAFNDYYFLQNVTCLATIPPTLADNTVFPYPNIATLTVPCGTLEDYSAPTSFWNMFFNGRISEDCNNEGGDSGLEDVEDTELSFYPNPTDSKITFSSTIEKIEVIDLTGRCVLTFSNAREINIESLPSGAYYLRLTNNDKAIMRKVIKE